MAAPRAGLIVVDSGGNKVDNTAICETMSRLVEGIKKNRKPGVPMSAQANAIGEMKEGKPAVNRTRKMIALAYNEPRWKNETR
ncbi:MAG: hypothetical protein RLQ26_00030 [Alphaproteobacteria bacterium]